MAYSYCKPIDKKLIRNMKGVISYLTDAKERHQQYADTPGWCNDKVGCVEFHQDCADRYREILEVLGDST